MPFNCAEWLTRPVATIRYQEIDRMLSKIRDGDGEDLKPRPPTANRLYAHLKDFFSWAERKERIKKSPMLGMELPVESSSPATFLGSKGPRVTLRSSPCGRRPTPSVGPRVSSSN